jgi:hypothetical protein
MFSSEQSGHFLIATAFTYKSHPIHDHEKHKKIQDEATESCPHCFGYRRRSPLASRTVATRAACLASSWSSWSSIVRFAILRVYQRIAARRWFIVCGALPSPWSFAAYSSTSVLMMGRPLRHSSESNRSALYWRVVCLETRGGHCPIT